MPPSWIGSLQVPGLARCPADIFEFVVIGLQLIVCHAPVLDGQLRIDEVLAVSLLVMAPHLKVGWLEAPMLTVPMQTGAAQSLAEQKGSKPAHGKSSLVRLVAEGQRLACEVLKDLAAGVPLDLVQRLRRGKVRDRVAIAAALEAHDPQSGVGELAGGNAARPAHSDDDDIHMWHLAWHADLPIQGPMAIGSIS